MAYSSEAPNWKPITNPEANQITGSSYIPGFTYSYETSSLPAPLQKLPGLKEAYISGYCSTYRDCRDVVVRGELVAARHDETGKAYVWFIGVSGSQVYYAGPCKPPDGHYYDTTSPVPLDKLFGLSPKPKEKND